MFHCVWLSSYLKILTDIYPFSAEIKGGTILIRSKCIIVTSNFKMVECFTGITLDTLRACFNVYDFLGPEPTFTERLKPKVFVLYMLRRHENMEMNVPDTSHKQIGGGRRGGRTYRK